MMERFDRFWTGAVAALLVTALIGGAALVITGDGAPAISIDATGPAAAAAPDIYVGGAVSNPGLYPLRPEDTVSNLLAAAGNPTTSPAPGHLRLIVYDSLWDSQRVDLNRADPWLLEALPEIGPETAKAIVQYRAEHGPFRMVQDLLRVPGIGDATLARVAELVTVGEQ